MTASGYDGRELCATASKFTTGSRLDTTGTKLLKPGAVGVSNFDVTP